MTLVVMRHRRAAILVLTDPGFGPVDAGPAWAE
jgi:hypothetical protein